MKSAIFVLALLAASTASRSTGTNPLQKVVELLNQLAERVKKDNDTAEQDYRQYFEWCDDISRSLREQIKTASREKAKLEARVGKSDSDIEISGTKVGHIAGSVARHEAELKDATALREKEMADFQKAEAGLENVIDTLRRATETLDKEMQQLTPAALAQLASSSTAKVIDSLAAIADAAALAGVDHQGLLALAQAAEDADGMDLDAPKAATYTSHSESVYQVLDSLGDKAEAQLRELRKAEANAAHEFAMVKQSLQDKLLADGKDIEDEKVSKAAAEQASAEAKGALKLATDELNTAKGDLAKVKMTCIQVAADHEANVASRGVELKAITEAVKVIQGTTSGAAAQTYSLVQVSAKSTRVVVEHRASAKVGRLVHKLAQEHSSAELAQLASRIATIERYDAGNGDDAFGKVKRLIEGMLSRLQAAANAEATEKAYCDEEMSKVVAKKGELDDDVSIASTKIGQAEARATHLQEQTSVLQGELRTLAKLQADRDQIRLQRHDEYETATTDLQQGLDGIQKAITVLHDYYATDEGAVMAQQDDVKFSAFIEQPSRPTSFKKATGAGGGIIGLLQVVADDFATNLAKEETEESAAKSAYEKSTQAYHVTKATKEKDLEYKTHELTTLRKTITEMNASLDTTDRQLAAVNEYYGKLQQRCVAKAAPYEERKQRRDSEIEGLEDALNTLTGE